MYAAQYAPDDGARCGRVGRGSTDGGTPGVRGDAVLCQGPFPWPAGKGQSRARLPRVPCLAPARVTVVCAYVRLNVSTALGRSHAVGAAESGHRAGGRAPPLPPPTGWWQGRFRRCAAALGPRTRPRLPHSHSTPASPGPLCGLLPAPQTHVRVRNGDRRPPSSGPGPLESARRRYRDGRRRVPSYRPLVSLRRGRFWWPQVRNFYSVVSNVCNMVGGSLCGSPRPCARWGVP